LSTAAVVSMAPCPSFGRLRKHKWLQPSFLKPLLRFGWRELIGWKVESLELSFPILHAEDGVNAFGQEVILPVQRVKVIGIVEEGCVFDGCDALLDWHRGASPGLGPTVKMVAIHGGSGMSLARS
jgi:hypothetical protein